jgi:hypothetical protein
MNAVHATYFSKIHFNITFQSSLLKDQHRRIIKRAWPRNVTVDYERSSKLKKKTKLHGLSRRANYTDRATPACRRSDCQLLRIEGATWPAWRIPTAVFSVFWTGAAAFLSSSSSVVLTRLSGPRSRPTTFFFWYCRESNPGFRICSQELWPLDHRGGHKRSSTRQKVPNSSE